MIGLTSCLKERAMNTDPDQSPAVIAFGNTGNNVAASSSTYPGFYADLGSIAAGSSATFNINVQLDGAADAQSDITVNLGLDANALNKYNTENGTGYVAPPAAVYTIPTSLTIKKGSRSAQGQAKITVNGSYDFSESYAIPIAITSTSNSAPVSSNFGKAIYSFGVRNVYDGLYTVKGYVSHPNASFTGPWSDDYCGDFALITTGQSSVDLDPGQPFSNNGSLAVFGVYPRFTVNTSTNKVTITDAAGSLASVESFPTYDSRYDPSTKTFYVKYGWNGSRVAIDTLVYCGPR